MKEEKEKLVSPLSFIMTKMTQFLKVYIKNSYGRRGLSKPLDGVRFSFPRLLLRGDFKSEPAEGAVNGDSNL